jgi:hypothetical protein
MFDWLKEMFNSATICAALLAAVIVVVVLQTRACTQHNVQVCARHCSSGGASFNGGTNAHCTCEPKIIKCAPAPVEKSK